MTVYYITLLAVFTFSIAAMSHVRGKDHFGRVTYNRMGNMYIFICTAILIFVAGFRYKVGTDYWEYMNGYEYRRDNWLQYVKEFDEPGIDIIARLGSYIKDSFATMFFLAAFITVGLIMWTIKKYSTNFVFSILLYLFIGCWHGCFNGIRQFLAMSIIFAGHRFLYEKKFRKYAIVVFIAMCFHKTAIIMLPVYFLWNKKLDIKTIFMSVGVAIIIRYSYDSIFSFVSFLQGSEVDTGFSYATSSVNSLRVLVTLAPLFLILISLKGKLIEEDLEAKFYAFMVIINAIFSFATANSAYLARATIYTEIFQVLAYPRLLVCFADNSKKVAQLIISCLFFIYWVIALQAANITNYQFVFGNI